MMSVRLISRSTKIKFIFPLILGFFLSFFNRKKHLGPNTPLVLVGGHLGKEFDDNAKAMYLYLALRTDVNVYWMQAKDSKYKIKEIENPKISTIGSIESYRLYFSSRFVFFTHSNSTDIAPLADHFMIHRPFEVYISHGIEALKGPIKGGRVEADLFTAVSPFEKKIKVEDWKLPSRNVKVTGMARFDAYWPSSDKKVRRILYLPTWREWDLGSDGKGWEESETYKHLLQLFDDQQLLTLLAENQAKLIFHPHPFMNGTMGIFKQRSNNYIKFDSSTPISQEIMDCDALITDYSSVAIDFLYLDKPLIFYQFDQSEFLKRRGAYLDYKTELFGPVVYNEAAVREEVQKLLEGDFESKRDSKISKKLFAFRDHENCKRIWLTAIKEGRIRHQSKRGG